MKRRLAMVPALAALLALTSVVSVSALEEADRLFMVGERALADRFYPVARRTLERFVAQYPRDPRLPRAVVMLGRAQLALADSQAALDTLTRAQSAPLPPAELLEAKFWQAEALFRLKRVGEARAAYDEVVRTDAASPLAPDALYGFAWCELELQHPQPAATAFREFLTAWPEHALAPNATLHLARALIELKRVGEALPLLTPFSAKYPGSKLIPDAQYLVGWAKLSEGDPRGGLADLEAFVAAHPSHDQAPAARLLIAQAAARHGDRAQMQQAYAIFMAQEPPTAEGLHEAATIATRLSRPKDLDAAWTRLRAQFPEHPLTRRLALDLADAAFKQKNWKDTIALARTAAQSDDDAVRSGAWLLVGESELKLRHLPQAVKAFEAVGAVGDVEAGIRYRALAGLGLAREEQKEWKAALTAYEAVVNRSPDSTLRDWARERVAAVKALLPPAPKRSEPPKPAAKPAGKK
ncbi:MAG TPA: tetratricopeptide repeat protein [Methylomirabilota bacterium]|nr:tetratricopeptide repeat protein [Methylomirabilota bacterium]